MPTKPSIKATTGVYTSVGILQHIMSDPNYPELNGYNGVITNTTESIRAVGEYITGYKARRNAFIDGLINRIGMVRLHYMLFNNPWSWAKQGKLEMGETIEQIWTDLAEVFPYDPKESETRILKQAPPDVISAFHTVNYEEVYKVTVNYEKLKGAFLSVDGLVDFIEDIIGTLARTANVDEFMIMKYLLAELLLAGKVYTQTLPAITRENSDEIITDITAVTNALQFPNTAYNMAHVSNTTPIDDLYILESARANAYVKVNSLAVAYNVDYVKFMGHVALFDSLGNFDWKRMNKIFSKDKTYRQFSSDEIAELNTIQFVAMDKRFLQIYDRLEEMGEPFINGEGRFTNYFYHVWKVLSASPFHNCIAFTTLTPAVTSVTISPGTATVAAGASMAFQAAVTTSGFGSSEVVWEIATSGIAEGTNISPDGVLTVAKNETAGEIEVVVTSVADETKTATATVTVG